MDHGITDYRKILRTYMRTVRRAEGITFCDHVPSKDLTKEEWGALYSVENDVERSYPDE